MRYFFDHTIGIMIWTWLILFTSCETKKGTVSSPLVNKEPVREHYLKDNYTRLTLPLRFASSSRYRLERDLKRFLQDSLSLVIWQNKLEGLEFRNADLDFFADTTNYFNHLLIIDMPLTSLNAKAGVAVKSIMQQHLKAAEALVPGLDIREQEAVFRQYGANKYFKFKHLFNFTTTETGYHQITYFVSTPKKTYYVHEISANEMDSEMWISGLKY